MTDPTKIDIGKLRIVSRADIGVPENAEVIMDLGQTPGTVNVKIRLPGCVFGTDLGDVPVEDGVLHLPLNMVFLCYAREDEEEVENLDRSLTNSGFLVWRDKRKLEPGDDWRAVIDDAIERADFVLILFSEKTCTRTGEVQREMKYALEQRKLRPARQKYIIPVRLTPCTPPKEFADIHWCDLFEPIGYERLCRTMRSSGTPRR